MMNQKTIVALLMIGVLGAAVIFLLVPDGGDERAADTPVAEAPTGDLMLLMSRAQQFAEKLHYAGSASNWALAAFYAHEMGEVGKELRDGGFEKGGVALEELAAAAFLPAVERVDRAIDVGPDAFRESFRDLVASCNACHAATGYGIIQIQVPDEPRPYPSQSFTP